MSIRYFCDKCDTEANSDAELFLLHVPDRTVANSSRRYHLCKRCLDRLARWLEPDPKEAPVS